MPVNVPVDNIFALIGLNYERVDFSRLGLNGSLGKYKTCG
jgi:hypothetical protein